MSKPLVRSIGDVPCLSLLQRCTTMAELKQVHARTVTHGLARLSFVASKLISFAALLSDQPDLPYAQTLLDQKMSPNVFDFNAMITGFCKNSRPEMGFCVYSRMRRLFVLVEPNSRTFVGLVKACSGLGLTLLGQVHGQVIKFGHGCDAFVLSSLITGYSTLGHVEMSRRLFSDTAGDDKNVVCWTSLLTGYCKTGLVEEARQVFDEMPERNDVCYSAMVSGYVRNGRFHEAIELFQTLKRTRTTTLNLKESLLIGVLSACASIGAFEQGKRIHEERTRNGFLFSVELATALIDFYAKCGSVGESQKIFDAIPDELKDVEIWSAMISGLALNGENDSALELFSEMEEKGPNPNAATFVGVLSACNHESLAGKALRFFALMAKLYNSSPEIEHYGCVVDLLARSGKLEKARALIETMPMEPDGAVWASLLNGCLIHRRSGELGRSVGNFLIRLEPGRSGGYVLLSNVYAQMGEWGRVARLREAMKENGVERFSAWSFVEIGDVVHKFVAGGGDDRSRDVFDFVERLNRVLENSFTSSFSSIADDVC